MTVYDNHRPQDCPEAVTDKQRETLLAYVRAAKQAAAVAGHQGHSAEDDSYHMGRSVAYQDIENLLVRKGK